MMLGAVVVPCNASEKDQILANFRLWSDPQLAPFNTEPEQKPKLVFVFNNDTARDAARDVEAAFEQRNLCRYFSSVDCWFLDLTGKADAYIRDYTVEVDENGYKAGPNNQFFKTMRAARDLGQYIFLMESDCIPIRPNWLGRLCKIVAGPEKFFVLGSAYRGKGTLGQQYNRHINGNAVYAVGDPAFQDFIGTFWEPELRRVVRDVDRRIAYDCVLDMLFSSMQSNLEGDDLWPTWQANAHRFRYSAYIQNISAKRDVNDPPANLIKQILANEPETYIIHSQAVAKAASLSSSTNPQSWLLAGAQPSTEAISELWPSPKVKREGDFYLLNGNPEDSYIASVLGGRVHKGDEVVALVKLTLREPARLSISLSRQGGTSFEGSTPLILDCYTGPNEISLRYTFRSPHAAARVQIASVGGRAFVAANNFHAIRERPD